MEDGEASELTLAVDVLPAGSSMVKLETSGEERRPIVSETPID